MHQETVDLRLRDERFDSPLDAEEVGMGQNGSLSKKQAKSEWERHSCGSGKAERFNSRKVVLEVVRHIAHVAQAQRILADGQVAASLIGDECRLKATRISVVWLSANDWSPAPAGSIYGGVEFVFDWRRIVAEYPYIYWVEEIPRYDPPAYRLLLAREAVSSDLVVRYDPSVAKGPLMREDGEWFWNGSHTSEFMIADDLDLDRCERIGFVPHRKCREYRSKCPDKGFHEENIRLLVLAYVVATGMHAADGALITRDFTSMNQIDRFVEHFCEVLGKWCGSKVRLRGSKTLQAAIRAILALWSYRDFESAKRLVRLLPNQEALHSTLCAVVAEHLGCKRYQARTMKDYFAE